jgi:hypothetical protein
MRLSPTTTAGRWSTLLLFGFCVGLGAFFTAVALGERGGDDFTSNWWLSGPALTAAACGVGAFAAGLLALRSRERALSVYFATLVGLAVTLFVATEIAFPH